MTKRLLPLGLIVLVALLLSPFLQTFVRELIVIPLLYLFWIGRFVYAAIPQSVLWSVLVGILALIMGLSLLLGRRKRKRRAHRPAEPPGGRIEGWAKLIQQAQNDDYFKWRLAQQLQKLTLNTLAHQRGQSLKQTRRQLREGTLEMPTDVQAYFQTSLQPLANLRPPKTLFSPKTDVASPLDLDPLKVVEYLESLNHETSSQESL